MSRQTAKDDVKVIPLGGMEEIGKNLTVIEYKDEILVVDCGMAFPGDELLGVDVVIPDITYLVNNADKVKGIILTHGHEDHIGALPYVLRELAVPVYGTRLTIGLLEGKLKEARGLGKQRLVVIKPGQPFKVGGFKIEAFHVAHSIPDAVAYAIHTPRGIIFHTGDFKFDQTPVNGVTMDYQRIGEVCSKGVLFMMSDSTNVTRDGYSMSESSVGESFERIFPQVKGRIIVATFASNVHRIQQVFNVAYANKRKVVVTGRSMINTVTIASEMGYLNIPRNTLIELDEMRNFPEEKLVVITTGSQGEPMAALSRMAMSEHRHVQINSRDTVLFSANPIPGNERTVSKVIDLLCKLGATVIQGSEKKIHVSGHACREELKMMLNLVKPKYFMPAHGEYRMLQEHANLAKEVGIDPKNVVIAENGSIVQCGANKVTLAGKVPSGRVLIDGLGVGDVGNIVLRDRKQLSEDGILIVVATINRRERKVVAGPDIVSRGFVYVREADDLMSEAKRRVTVALDQCVKENTLDWNTLKVKVRDALGKYLFDKTRRKPMILPIILEEKNGRKS